MLCKQVLEGAELDFSRYGETLFEVLFAGGRMAAGGNVVSEKENKRLEFTVNTVYIHGDAHCWSLAGPWPQNMLCR